MFHIKMHLDSCEHVLIFIAVSTDANQSIIINYNNKFDDEIWFELPSNNISSSHNETDFLLIYGQIKCIFFKFNWNGIKSNNC